jgi:DhnA family fructose-bisphosphate aldolase class Ia
MTIGLQRNTKKLFSNDGYLFLLALDHAQMGVVQGLEDIPALLTRFSDSGLDGFILNVGLARNMANSNLVHKKLVLRSSSGGSQLATEFAPSHANHVRPETAVALGADAVLMMAVVGGADYQSLQAVAKDIDAYHQLSIPVIVEIIAADFSKTATFDIQYHGARIASELGADVVKVFYVEGFDKVAACCPVPVILAGGPKDQDICDVASRAIAQGAKGFAFGRNIFQSDKPEALINELKSILR